MANGNSSVKKIGAAAPLKRALAGAALVGLLLASDAAGVQVNKDVTNINLGIEPASGLVLVIAGPQTGIGTFDGYPDARFSTIEVQVSSDTALRWSDFEDNDNDRVDAGQTVHVGYGHVGNSSAILGMWWTDAAGSRLGGEFPNVTPHWQPGNFDFDGDIDSSEFIWESQFPSDTIHVANVHWTVVTSPLPLADLNAQNADLDRALRPLPGGASFDLHPPEPIHPPEPFRLRLDQPIPAGGAVILRYEVSSSGRAARSLDFVQFVVPEPAALTLLALALPVLLIGRRCGNRADVRANQIFMYGKFQ